MIDTALSHPAAPAPRSASPASGRPPTWAIVAVLLVAELLLAWSVNEFMLTREAFAAATGERLDPDQIDRMLALSRRFQWAAYAFALPALLARVGFVALCLQLALLLLEELPLRFGDVFRVALLAHAARIAEAAATVGWLSRADEATRVARMMEGGPFAVASAVDRAAHPVLHELAQLLTAGQVAWLVLIVWLLAAHTGRRPGTLAITCTLTWAMLLASRFALFQLLALLRG